jgi:hypothetical protein
MPSSVARENRETCSLGRRPAHGISIRCYRAVHRRAQRASTGTSRSSRGRSKHAYSHTSNPSCESVLIAGWFDCLWPASVGWLLCTQLLLERSD